MESEINILDIVVLKDKIVQYLGKKTNNKAIVQDIKAIKEIIQITLVVRKATRDERKWFCENIKNIHFSPPS